MSSALTMAYLSAVERIGLAERSGNLQAILVANAEADALWSQLSGKPQGKRVARDERSADYRAGYMAGYQAGAKAR